MRILALGLVSLLFSVSAAERPNHRELNDRMNKAEERAMDMASIVEMTGRQLAQERVKIEQETKRTAALAAKLRELGIDPESLS